MGAIFDTKAGLYADRARNLFISLFEQTACEAPPMVFAAGVQIIASRHAIRSRPLDFWEFIEDSLIKCHAYGYDLERMWLFLLNSKIPVKDKAALSLPAMCFGDGHSVEKIVTWKCKKYN